MRNEALSELISPNRYKNFRKEVNEMSLRICILINFYEFLKFSTCCSISHYGMLRSIMSNAFSISMTQLAGREQDSFQQLSKLTELIIISTT